MKAALSMNYAATNHQTVSREKDDFYMLAKDWNDCPQE